MDSLLAMPSFNRFQVAALERTSIHPPLSVIRFGSDPSGGAPVIRLLLVVEMTDASDVR
jgi:hypothetical protein